MIVLLTDEVIIDAADRGARRFIARNFYGASWIGSPPDVMQEARTIALDFLRQFGNPRYLNPFIISRRVYFSLLDLIRSRSKRRTKNPAPTFLDSDFALVPGSNDAFREMELSELFQRLKSHLTRKEKTSLELLRQGYSKADIARRCNVSLYNETRREYTSQTPNSLQCSGRRKYARRRAIPLLIRSFSPATLIFPLAGGC